MAAIDQAVLTGLGGLAAEHVYDGKPEHVRVGGALHDIENIQILYRKIIAQGFSTEDILAAHLDRAVEILEKKWVAVQALTKRLIADSHIGGDRVVRIIEDNS
jgi:hypothetical protein